MAERDGARGTAKRRAAEVDPDPEVAAHLGVHAGRLLDGEDPETLQVHDADHWTRVYQDLLEFKRQLLATAHQMAPAMDRVARNEVDKTDMIVMDAESKKFERRLEFWRQRRIELGGAV